mmetsp:Transcript_3139/g.6378  ORF Transcript_3139/g.6378 Transcript_3139/m.6378 type:complete len:605 (+) Transcript_3139:171-1985(+)
MAGASGPNKILGMERNMAMALISMSAVVLIVVVMLASLDKDGQGYEHTFSSLPAFIIVLRETLEATVLLAVLIQYLQRTEKEAVEKDKENTELKAQFAGYVKQVWWGAAIGGTGTVIFGTVILTLYYTADQLMPPKVAYIVEGVLLFFASIELTYFFVTHLAPGMKSDNQWKKKWEINLGGLVDEVIAGGDRNKFMWLTASTVFREGFEAVVFITPFAPLAPPWALTIAGIMGLLVGLILGITTFMGSQKMDLTKFFIAASVFFLFMSAGLMGHASYEFQKAGVFGTWACGHFNGTTYSLDDVDSGDSGVGYRRLTDMFAHNVGFDEVPGFRQLGGSDEMDASCYSKVVTGDGTDDYFAYRRLGSVASDDDEFYTRTKSCDCHKNHEVAWVNVEIWDTTGCCDIGFEGSGLFFFVMMILFWYRPQMSRLELIMMCMYYPFALTWAYMKIKQIRGYNETLKDDDGTEMVTMLEDYDVTFTGAKLGLDLADKNGAVTVASAKGENAGTIGAFDRITALNGTTLASLGIKTHNALAAYIGSHPERPLVMTLMREVRGPKSVVAVPVATVTEAGGLEEAVPVSDETASEETAMVTSEERGSIFGMLGI